MTTKQYYEILKVANKKRRESSDLITKSELLADASSRLDKDNDLWRVYIKFAHALLDKSKVLHEEVKELIKVLEEEDNREVIDLLYKEVRRIR